MQTNRQPEKSSPARPSVVWIRSLPLSSLPDGQPISQQAGSESILLLRQGDALFACEATCPHKFADLRDGTVCGQGRLRCPQHEATFDLESGDPDEAWAGALAVYPVRVVDGHVEVDLPEP